jgi:hypothetical protein
MLALTNPVRVINRKFLVAIAIALVLYIAPKVVAQQSGQPSRKIDEFIGEVDYEDLIARLDNFFMELMKQPNAQGHIIVYRSRRDSPSISQLYGRRAENYLIKLRRIDRNRLVIVDGGMSGCLMYELWIVPPSGSSPERRYTYKYPLKTRIRGRH